LVRNGYGTGGTGPPLKGGPLLFTRSAHIPVEKKIFVGLIFFCSFDQPFSILSIFNFFLMSKNLIFIGLAFLGWLGYKKYILAQKINISLKNIGFNGGNFLNPIVNVQLEVENPTNTTADVQKISAEILLQNKVVGTVYQDINKTILANQKTVIDFDVNLKLQDAAIVLIQNKFKNQIIELKGNLIVDFVYFPLNFQIQLP